MSISVNLAGSVPSWNEDASLPLAAGRAAKAASLAAVESLLTGLETGSGAAPAHAIDAGGAAAQGRVSAQAQAPVLPVLSAQPIAARALPARDSLGMPEDWFESSVSAKNISDAGIIEAAAPAQFTHASLNLNSRLDVTPLSEGLVAGAIDHGRQMRSNQVEFETVPVQILSAEAAAGAVAANAPLGGRRPEWQRIQQGDQGDRLMNEIPLLFAPIPVEPQQEPIRTRFKAILVNGMLMLGAVLAVILAGTLNLRDLSGIEMMELAAGGLAFVGVLFLIFRWARSRPA